MKTIVVLLFTTILAACGNTDPGPLSGTWQASGIVPFRVTFRPGESEAMGMIEKVSYKQNGADVLVTTESGPMKGIVARYSVVDQNTLRTEIGVLRRVQ